MEICGLNEVEKEIFYEWVSHHEMVRREIETNDKQKPFAPENGELLKFKVGDKVIFTNEYGVKFSPREVTGFYKPEQTSMQYALGKRYHIDSDSPWMPVSEESLTLNN